MEMQAFFGRVKNLSRFRFRRDFFIFSFVVARFSCHFFAYTIPTLHSQYFIIDSEILSIFKFIAVPTQGNHKFTIFFQISAQHFNMRIHGTIIAVEIEPPNVVEQFFTG